MILIHQKSTRITVDWLNKYIKSEGKTAPRASPMALSLKHEGHDYVTLPLGESEPRRRRGLLKAKNLRNSALPVGEPPTLPGGG